MATYGDEPVDSYFYSSYNPYTGRYPRPKEAGWKYKRYLSHYGDTSEAFKNHQRAQLKSILSQINPKLTPRLRKANTKDVAVQVNPKRDASVQCSIGPRTLLALKRDFRRKKKQEPATLGDGGGSPKAAAAGGVRYPRTLAVYSPIAYRSITSFLVEDNKACFCDAPPGDSPQPAGKKSKYDQAGEEEKSASLTDQPKKSKQVKSEDSQLTSEGSKVRARVRFQVSSVDNYM